MATFIPRRQPPIHPPTRNSLHPCRAVSGAKVVFAACIPTYTTNIQVLTAYNGIPDEPLPSLAYTDLSPLRRKISSRNKNRKVCVRHIQNPNNAPAIHDAPHPSEVHAMRTTIEPKTAAFSLFSFSQLTLLHCIEAVPRHNRYIYIVHLTFLPQPTTPRRWANFLTRQAQPDACHLVR